MGNKVSITLESGDEIHLSHGETLGDLHASYGEGMLRDKTDPSNVIAARSVTIPSGRYDFIRKQMVPPFDPSGATTNSLSRGLKRKREPTSASNLSQPSIATKREVDQPSFDLLDKNICETVTSFCDFYSALRLGRTCHRFKEISDRVLDQSADKVLSELPISHNKRSDDEGILYNIQDGWQSRFLTKGALIDWAIEHISDLGYENEGRARRLLRTRGGVDDDDFIDEEDYLENRWIVKLRFDKDYSLSSARDFVWDISEWDWESGNLVKEISHAPWESGFVVQEVSNAKDEWLRYSLFCILRKYRHSFELKFASIRWDTQHNDYHVLRRSSSLMIQIDDRKIEFSMTVVGRVSMDDWFKTVKNYI